MRYVRRISSAFVIASALAVAACSGGGGSSGGVPNPGPTAQYPGSVAFTSSVTDGTVQIPPPYGTASGGITVTTSLTAPSGVPAANPIGAHTTLLYVGVTFADTVVLNGQLGFVIDPPNGVDLDAGPLYVAYFDASTTSWNYGFAGPGAQTGGKIVFSPAPGQFTFQGGTTYYYALLQVTGSAPTPTPTASPTPTPTASPTPTPTPTASPTPTPTPTASPTPTPTPTPNPLTVTSSSISLIGAGATYAQSFQVAEDGYTGAITESDTCAGIATPAPINGNGPTLNVTVTGVAAGTCAITYFDSYGQSVGVNVTVTTASIGVQ